MFGNKQSTVKRTTSSPQLSPKKSTSQKTVVRRTSTQPAFQKSTSKASIQSANSNKKIVYRKKKPEPTTFFGKNKKVLIIGGSVILFLFIVGVIIIFVLRSKKSSTTTPTPPPSSSSNSNPAGVLPVGAQCFGITDCIPTAYCAESGICVLGTGKQLGDLCVNRSQCVIGLYCDSANTCASGSGMIPGGPCTVDTECRLGYSCQGGFCDATSSSQPVPSCTKVGVYQLRYPSSCGQLTNWLPITLGNTPPAGSTFYPTTSPLFYGCNSLLSANTQPIYMWQSSTMANGFKEFVLCLSNTQLFTIGNSMDGITYTVMNSGNPVVYLFSSQISSQLLPVRRVVARSLEVGNSYHCVALNSNGFEAPGGCSDPGSYALDNDAYGGVLLGWASIL